MSTACYLNYSNELKQRSERNVISQFNSSELKQRSERSLISQFNSSELRKSSERNYFSMTCVTIAL